jgi:hypothetical protein
MHYSPFQHCFLRLWGRPQRHLSLHRLEWPHLYITKRNWTIGTLIFLGLIPEAQIQQWGLAVIWNPKWTAKVNNIELRLFQWFLGMLSRGSLLIYLLNKCLNLCFKNELINLGDVAIICLWSFSNFILKQVLLVEMGENEETLVGPGKRLEQQFELGFFVKPALQKILSVDDLRWLLLGKYLFDWNRQDWLVILPLFNKDILDGYIFLFGRVGLHQGPNLYNLMNKYN